MGPQSPKGLVSIGGPPVAAHQTVKDPVCHMDVDPNTAAGKYEYKGTTYYFCNPRCLERFRADPDKYLIQEPAPPTAAKDVYYTCPMHPEVRQLGPGSCPKCGMALEPEMITAAEEANPELDYMQRR